MDYITVWHSSINVVRPIVGMPQPLVISREKQGRTYHIRPGERTPENRFTFQYTLRGRGRISWRGKLYDVPAGHGFLTQATDPEISYFYPEDAQESWQFVFFDFRGALDEQVAGITERWGPVHALDPHRGIVQRLLDFEQYGDQVYSMTASRGADLVGDLFSSVLKGHELSETQSNENVLVRRAQIMLHDRIATGMNASGLAKELGVTREHLSRLFKAELGISPYQYILHQRISLAMQLLKNSTRSCKQIAQDCGFETSSLFNNAFKQNHGLTPRRYRQQNGGRVDKVSR